MKNKKLKHVTLPEIMFVCSGNTCRSPMAEHLMKWLCRERGISADVYSKGIFTSSEYVSLKAEDVMLELDSLTEISRHIPLKINYADFEKAGLVLTMQEIHLEDLATDFRLEEKAMGKVFTLREYAGFKRDFDIKDPMCAAYTPGSFILEAGESTSYGNADSTRKRWKEDPVKALNTYRECRDEIRQCLERILANPKPNVKAILKARAERVRKSANIKTRYAGTFPSRKKGYVGASFWERWDGKPETGEKVNQASFIPGRTYGSAQDVIDVESKELTEAEIQELNEEWARSRRGGN